MSDPKHYPDRFVIGIRPVRKRIRALGVQVADNTTLFPPLFYGSGIREGAFLADNE
jgi:hypothetical protein